MEKSLKHLVIFASGAGSNAKSIIDFFKQTNKARVALIVCNNPDAGVITIAENEKIPVLLISKKHFLENGYLPEIKNYDPDLIILAGFLWKIPEALIKAFPRKIVNIHPALLPGFGGKGMYGMAVHEAVIKARENQSGITIHFVDEFYDNGKIIFQATCPVHENDTAELLAQRIHALEYEYFPKVIEKLIAKRIKTDFKML